MRRGKAPPVDTFCGVDPECRFEDWLPTLKRAAKWNGWTEDDLLLQLAGHLKGRALQEWNLLPDDQKSTYDRAVAALRGRLDPGSRVMAAQDFRHAAQDKDEKVGDFIHRLERLFRLAYGHDSISDETRCTLLYGQLQEGLRHKIMEAPAVSGATDYKSLCIAAKTEERRLAELKKRRQYRPDSKQGQNRGEQSEEKTSQRSKSDTHSKGKRGEKTVRCWNCDEQGHVAADCRAPKRENKMKAGGKGGAASKTRANQIQTAEKEETHAPVVPITTPSQGSEDDPRQYLLPDSDEEVQVDEIRVSDQGSCPQTVRVVIAGVPVEGVVDTAADITIIGAEVFKRIASVAKLRRRHLKPVDKTPHTYDRKTFHLDGRLDLDITFDGRTMTTPIYVKMDAKEQLLISEGVCRQLGIVRYHEQVIPGNSSGEGTSIPLVRVELVQSIKLKPEERVVAEVRLVGEGIGGGRQDAIPKKGVLLVESDERHTGARITASLIKASADGVAQVLLSNSQSVTHRIAGGTVVGQAVPVEVVKPRELDKERSLVNMVSGEDSEIDSAHKKKLIDQLQDQLCDTPETQKSQLVTLLARYDHVFSLTESERGETDRTTMHIDTGSATPRKQPVRRVLFAVREELACQLMRMQEQGVIQPSSSPWASPIVLVRKKDGTLRICVDYRHLNSVTKPDTFPLPRIDDLLDQLGSAKCFTTLDLAAGYWQIRVAEDSVEKTAFVTPTGLFEFRVMPFGLTNAPAVFQRLMQKVLNGLNPARGPGFVVVYIDDILIYSRTLDDHLSHIGQVLNRLQAAGLKLKASKCHFLRQEVEYLGHLITPKGLLPNPNKVCAVTNYPAPASVTQVRQFVGLVSYYRRFVRNFARLAAPLHRLMQKDITFYWTMECQEAFEALKKRLVEAPVLVYPDFSTGFVLETDASYQGLGAVLSQKLEDRLLHPVAFASRALAKPEKNYAVTELETLAVVWAVKHFRAYLYGHDVEVVTDHSAVKSLLTAPSPSGKHARWWLQVFGSGLRSVNIVYRSGKQNSRADALSRNPTETESANPHPVDVQVAAIESQDLEITDLLNTFPVEGDLDEFHVEQNKDPELKSLRHFLEYGILPTDEKKARKMAAQALNFVIIDKILYFVDSKGGGRKRAAVPIHLQKTLLEDHHRGKMAGHFSGARIYAALSRRWWWRTMYTDAQEFSRNCGECATVTGVGRRSKPPLHPIPVQKPFQIVGVDIMELPITTRGNRYVIVFQDFLTKWPLVFAAPDQKAIRIARLVAEELFPMFGVPDALLSDRGANLLAHVMQDVCQLLGVKKLNTTSYHPQCDGMVERLNRTLKTMLRKQVARFGGQWDQFLPGILWAYRNTPHEATKEKPSFLLFGLDLKSPTEAALLPPAPLSLTDLDSYREELILSLSTARDLAVASIRQAQQNYKTQYDKGVRVVDYKIGDWVFVHFPEEETGKQRKMLRPWYGPFRVVARQDPNVRVSKVYFPEDLSILVHQLRVCPSPSQLPAGFFWYGARRRSSGRVPRWLQTWLSQTANQEHPDPPHEPEESSECEEPEHRDEGLFEMSPDLLSEPDPAQPEQELPEPCLPIPALPGSMEQEPCETTMNSNVNSGHYELRDRRLRKPPARLMQCFDSSSGRTA